MKAVAAIFSSLLLTVATALPAQTGVKTAPLGIWRGTLDGVPSVTLTLADDTGELNGTIVFYAVDGEKKQAISIEPHTLLRPRLAGDTLNFQIRRPDGALLSIQVHFAADSKAQLQCLNCDGSPIADLTKDKL